MTQYLDLGPILSLKNIGQVKQSVIGMHIAQMAKINACSLSFVRHKIKCMKGHFKIPKIEVQ